MGGATEHQQYGTPHFHGEVHVACMYQFCTMQEIADKIENGWVAVQDIINYQSWLHREEPFDKQQYERDEETIYEEWKNRFNQPLHNPLCTTPSYIANDTIGSMWGTSHLCREEEAFQEGDIYRKLYHDRRLEKR